MQTEAPQTPVAMPVAVVGDRCGEGAVWSPEEQAVYWTDINRFLVHRLTWPDRRLRTWYFDEPPTALALSREPGRLLVALASQLIWWWPADDRRAGHGFKLGGRPGVRFNDGRADPLGNFWIGSMYNNVAADGGPTTEHHSTGSGALYRVAPNGTVAEAVRGIGIANTLCWSPNHATFYSADTMKNEIRRYAFDAETGDLSAEAIHFAGCARGVPDGSAIDREGCLWNARWGGGGLIRIAPDGSHLGFYPVPTTNVTTCTFGGPDLTTLFITSARNDSEPGDRLAGSLWALEVGVTGMPDYRVAVS